MRISNYSLEERINNFIENLEEKKNILYKYIRDKLKIIDGFVVEEVNEYEMGSKDILGMTSRYGNWIRILDRLEGWLKEKVKQHETEHHRVQYSGDLGEYLVRARTGTLEEQLPAMSY